MTITAGPLAGRMARRAAQIRPSVANVFEVKADQFLQITDMAGKQVADMIALNSHDYDEFLSPAHTRAGNNSIMLQKEHGLEVMPYETVFDRIQGRAALVHVYGSEGNRRRNVTPHPQSSKRGPLQRVPIWPRCQWLLCAMLLGSRVNSSICCTDSGCIGSATWRLCRAPMCWPGSVLWGRSRIALPAATTIVHRGPRHHPPSCS